MAATKTGIFDMPLESTSAELKVLYHVSHSLLHQRDVSSLLSDALDALKDEMGVRRAALSLRRGGRLHMEASTGLSELERKRGRYNIGEGVTGKVAATGRSIVIPDISTEPAFLNKTGFGKTPGYAFVCVPVRHEGEIIGTLSIDHPTVSEKRLKSLMGFLETLANILADAVATLRAEVEEKELLQAENERLKRELGEHFQPPNIVGNCGAMKTVYGQIAQVASGPATVLIRGESGTGKELVAKAVHHASPRKDLPFVAINCAALPENLVESELFGHEKGAFTGAHERRKGRFEVVGGGTLFLDEIGDIPLSVQVKLLRVLQERSFERVGGHESITTGARIIAATSRNMEEAIADGTFREDLYYRLNVFPIHLPALRERKSDMMLLADHFLEKYNKIYGKNIRRISTPAINMMVSYHWPGNVRELESCVERAVLVSSNDVVTAYSLPPSLQTAKASGTTIAPDGKGADFTTLVNSFERELIVDALKNTTGNVAAAARNLGLTKRILHYKILKLGMTPRDYR